MPDIPNSLNGEEKAEEISLGKRFFNLRTLISFVVAFGILFLVFWKLDVDFGETWAVIRGCDPVFYALAFVSYYLSFPLRAVRWRLLLESAGFRRENGIALPSTWGLTQLIMINWFANSIVYARLGDAYRAYLLRESAGVTFSKTIGTVLSERVLDIIVIYIIAMAAIVWLLLSGSPGMGIAWVVLATGIVMLLAIAFLIWGMGHFGSSLQRRLPQRIKNIYALFEEGTLGSFGRLPLLGLVSLGIWLLEASRLILVTQALGFNIFEIGIPLLIFAALASALLTAIPLTPGGLGLVESGIAGLLMIALPPASAWSIAFVDRTISFLSVIVVGLIVFSLWHLMRARDRRKT